jgi:GT2 family glycosyltransferase
MSRLSVILLNYNGARDTIDCIESLQRSSFEDFEVVVVDNASFHDSVELLKIQCPDTTLIINSRNMGFAGGNNIGIRHALNGRSEFILLLNNDTTVDSDALATLVKTMEENPQAGIVGGKVYYSDRPKVIWFAGGYFNPNSGFGDHYGKTEEDCGQYNTVRQCDFITGCCMLVRRGVFEKIGLLDDSYFLYYEDVDFCTRARHVGYSVLYQPGAVIYHKISQATSWDSPVYVYFNLRNKIFYLRKNSRAWKWLPHLPRLTYFYFRQLARLTLKWHDFPAARAAWLGLVDGLHNFSGEYGEGHLSGLGQSR